MNRISIQKVEPKAYQAMFGLEDYLAKVSLNAIQKELIKTRASQINKCAYCIDMHTSDARKIGESEQRLYLLAAWQETEGIYTDEETILLAMTDEITLIQGGLSDATYSRAIELLGEQAVAEAIIAIATINAWNRIAISTHMHLDIVKK